jgi:hypothetical protein
MRIGFADKPSRLALLYSLLFARSHITLTPCCRSSPLPSIVVVCSMYSETESSYSSSGDESALGDAAVDGSSAFSTIDFTDTSTSTTTTTTTTSTTRAAGGGTTSAIHLERALDFSEYLPWECVVHIFSYLDAPQLSALLLVSRQWNRLAGHDHLVRHDIRLCCQHRSQACI